MELVNVNLYAEGYYSGATYEDNIWIKESSYEKLRDIFPTEIGFLSHGFRNAQSL